MKFSSIIKKKISEDRELGMNVPPTIIMKVHSILKKEFPNCEVIQEYPNATAFYHFINQKWK